MWMLPFGAALAATWPEIEPPPATAGGAADAAVIVGVDAYPFLDDVPGARANAEDWFRYLTKTRGLSPARVHLLRDVEGTREKVLKELERAVAEAGPDGTVWFVFVGHGAPTPDGRDGVLVGADAQADPDSLFARSVPRSQVLEELGAGAHARSVVVLDTCFSGRSGRGSLLPDLQFVVPTWAAEAPDATVLTAGTATQFAGPLPGAGRPAFSYLVLGALTGWGDTDGDGQVSAAEAVGYAKEAIAATVRGRDQTPELSGPDTVLAKAAARPGPDLVELAIGAAPRPTSGGGVLDAAELDARRAAVEAEQAAAKREQERVAALAKATRDALDDAAAAKQAEARAAFDALWPRLESDDPTAEADARAFATTWAGARVTVGDADRAVEIPEVDRVVAWLARDRPSSVAVRAPTRLGRVSVLALWQPSWHAWKVQLPTDPERIWDPYRWVEGHAWSIEGQAVSIDRRLTEQDVRPLLDLAVDAAAYGEAWWAGDAERKKDLEYALVGLLEEARDASTAVRGGTFHVEQLSNGRTPEEDFFVLTFSTPRSLVWAIHEVTVRAEKAGEACDAERESLEALEAKAGAFIDDVEADPVWEHLAEGGVYYPKSWHPTYAKFGRKLLGLADRVHACSGT